MRFTAIIAAVCACLAVAAVARSGTRTHLQQREHRQVVSLHRYAGTLRFFRHHPRLARTVVGRREVRRARVWVTVIRRELAETRAQLHPRWAAPWPSWWYGQAMCIHRYEATDWHERSNPSSRGGMQIQYATWASVGGHGDPADAAPAEQLYRAWLIWSRDGGSWREWTTASRCGLG